MSKKKRVKSKAAQATAKKKAEREATSRGGAETGHPEAVEWKGGGGLMTGMRGGFQGAVAGVTDKKKKGGWLNTVLWIAIIAGAVAFIIGKQ